MENASLPLHWHFDAEDMDDLPGNFVAGPNFSSTVPLPLKDDLVSFTGLPGVRFTVWLREFVFSANPERPVALHIHVRRLGPLPA